MSIKRHKIKFHGEAKSPPPCKVDARTISGLYVKVSASKYNNKIAH